MKLRLKKFSRRKVISLCHKRVVETNLPSAADGGDNAVRLTDTRATAENWDSSVDWTWSKKGIAISFLKYSSGLFEGGLLWWHCHPVMWGIDSAVPTHWPRRTHYAQIEKDVIATTGLVKIFKLHAGQVV